MSEFDPNNYPKAPSRLDILKNRLARSKDNKDATSEDLWEKKLNGSGSGVPEGAPEALSALTRERIQDRDTLKALENDSVTGEDIPMPEDEIASAQRMQALRRRFGSNNWN